MSDLYVSECIPSTCPYCGLEYSNLITGTPEKKVQMDISECRACNMPYVTRQEIVLKVTTHRIDGLLPVEPQIKFEYEADIPLAQPEELKKVDDIERYTPRGTQPDPSQFLCDSCGTLNGTRELHIQPNGEKWCVTCIGRDMEDRCVETSSNKLVFNQIHGNVWAAISGESVHLKYGNSKCGIWDRTIFDTLLEMTEEERRKEIDELVKGMASKQQRKACLRQFTIALEKGEISFPEVA